MSKRNADWQRDELILALDLYFRSEGGRRLSQTHPDVVELSRVLNSLPIHGNDSRDGTFRNPNGCYMKLGNFRRFDAEFAKLGHRGLTRGNQLEEVVWNDFASNRLELVEIARTIRSASVVAGKVEVADVADADEGDFPEGKILYRLHRIRERNSVLTEKAKRRAAQNGGLKCAACDFDFLARYGEIGRGYIECHHTLPLSEYLSATRTSLKDLALVCANCHRMLHRKRPWLTIGQLKSVLQ